MPAACLNLLDNHKKHSHPAIKNDSVSVCPVTGGVTANGSILIYLRDNLDSSTFFLVYFKLYPGSSWNRTENKPNENCYFDFFLMGRRYAYLASSEEHHEVVFLGHENVLHLN